MSALPVPAPAVEEIEAELDSAMDALAGQSELYRPSSFWEQASSDIAAQLRDGGLERFRRLPGPLAYFVPTYGMPGNGFTPREGEALKEIAGDRAKQALTIGQLLSGQAAATADFRVLQAADIVDKGPDLRAFSESLVGRPLEQFRFDGRRFSRSSLNYLLGLCLLKRHLEPNERIATVMEIGGGFGSLGEILLSGGDPETRYVDLDIPPTGVVAQYYLSGVLGPERVATFRQTRDRNPLEIDELPPASVLCNWQIESLRGKVDLFVNFISFQEMEPAIVGNYLEHVTRLETRWILLRNMREGKQRRTASRVGVIEPIVSEDYLAMLPDYELIERNVSPFGYRTVDGYHSELLLLRRRGAAWGRSAQRSSRDRSR